MIPSSQEGSRVSFCRVYVRGADISDVFTHFLTTLLTYILIFFCFFVSLKLEGCVPWPWISTLIALMIWYGIFIVLLLVYNRNRNSDDPTHRYSFYSDIWGTFIMEKRLALVGIFGNPLTFSFLILLALRLDGTIHLTPFLVFLPLLLAEGIFGLRLINALKTPGDGYRKRDLVVVGTFLMLPLTTLLSIGKLTFAGGFRCPGSRSCCPVDPRVLLLHPLRG
ncbi:hypothetical protein PAPYR_5030 [Paratrimastix pyriformis]|uniref:Uncharacterized protein n=1 Tax=Paratrimastix pyriformis TaxID=342808 RepID=A0ABQ8UID7_9EUKA|nr:hypothetical protein PAPYR_5030 [Paratrimastix pyriformis]